MGTVHSRLATLRPDRRTLFRLALVLSTELLVVLTFAVFGAAEPRSLGAVRLWVYPWIWINVAGWAVWWTSPADAPARTRRLAGVLAVGYLAVLAYAGGLVGPSHHGPGTVGVVWRTVPPGWGPALTYAGDVVAVTLVPYRALGYLGLAYLVYATVIDAARTAVTGVLGILSCVSCSWPVLASLVTGVVGSGSGLAAAVTTGAYGFSTLVFVVTVALLYWRPFGDDEE